tara:strand:+ start:86867 stop:87664 length:798 start_codon:yes stop_codon:yes gene_type:complete
MLSGKLLAGKTALVTGSTSGIGHAMASKLAEAGANVVLHGLMDPTEGETLRQDFEQQYDVQCLFSGADISTAEGNEELVAVSVEKFGGVDILINNAGIQFTAPIEEFPVAKWDAIIGINLSSAFHTTRLLISGMQQRGWGRIINIASVHGLVASLNKAAYVAAKHGIVGLTKVVALENADKGVTVNAICPGWVDTHLVAAQFQARADRDGVSLEEGKRSVIVEKQPMPKATPPSSLGDLALFLCSDAAATITGISLPIDGGWTAQ